MTAEEKVTKLEDELRRTEAELRGAVALVKELRSKLREEKRLVALVSAKLRTAKATLELVRRTVEVE